MGLDNDAFRKFLGGGRVEDEQSAKTKKRGSAKSGNTSSRGGIGFKGARNAIPEKEEAPKYRDRADERRRGVTVEESAPSYLTAEETRYLGGTIERTHLVRGLDRLLLNQVRDQGTKPEAAAPSAPLAAEEDAARVPASQRTALGRAVATNLLKPPSSNVAELFQPRRMAFVYFNEDKAGDDPDSDEEGVELDWGPNDADDAGVRDIPETLLRSKADCPVPPDALNAAIDKEVLFEVVGVVKAVRVESKFKAKDKKRIKDDAEGSLAAALKEKEKHILQLRKFENPKLVAELAARDASGSQAERPAPSAATARANLETKGATGVQGQAKQEDSGGSGLFDDVGDDYEVDTSRLRKAQNAKADLGNAPLFTQDTHGLPTIAQHGHAVGNDASSSHTQRAGQEAGHTSGRQRAPPPQFHGHPGYGVQAVSGHGSYNQYPHLNGYYDMHGNWVSNAQHGPEGQWGGTHGAPYVTASDLQLAAKSQAQGNSKGKGFSAKMGDRANVKSAFTTEQRQARVGRGVVEGGGDEYGADILIGGGGVDEEEEDLKAMESRSRTLTRADFHTDEQYQAYKASKEAAPKAAFQFGVKVQDGRRSHKDMEKASNRKIESQLRSIRDLKGNVGGRKVDFTQFDGAFGGSKGGDVAPTPSRKRIKL